MRILITGATGLLGNNLVRALVAAKQHDVRVLARASSDPRSLEGLHIERALGDVTDADAVRAAAAGCQAIIHCAGIVQLGWTRLAESRAVNVTGTKNVIAGAQAAGARLVHISTVNTLAIGQRDTPADEETPRAGQIECSYVVSKREGEQLVDDAQRAGLDAVVIHPGFLLGPWDWKPSSGKMLLAIAHRFTPFAPIGGCSVCDVRDVAATIVAATERAPSGRHYLLAGHNISYFDLWKQMAQVSGGAPPRVRLGPVNRWLGGWFGDLRAKLTGNEGDVNSASIAMSSQWHYYSSARAERELDYRVRPLEESLRDAWAWLQEHGPTKTS